MWLTDNKRFDASILILLWSTGSFWNELNEQNEEFSLSESENPVRC